MCNSELFAPVKGWEGYYEVSNLGNIRTVARYAPHSKPGYNRIIYGRMVATRANKKRSGYVYVRLKVGNSSKTCLVHRLVAEAFILNPNNLPCVNHKDFNTSNNKVENIEWCTHEYNSHYSKHRRPNMRGKYGRRIIAYNMSGEMVGEYGSVRDAARELGCHGQNICSVLSGKNKYCKGYTFSDKPE